MKTKGKTTLWKWWIFKKKKRFIEYYFKYIVYVYLRLKPNKFIICFKNINQKLKKTPFVYMFDLCYFMPCMTVFVMFLVDSSTSGILNCTFTQYMWGPRWLNELGSWITYAVWVRACSRLYITKNVHSTRSRKW